MNICSLEIKNYKSIHVPFCLENPGKLHFFIGQNNSGKTNILDAISELYSDMAPSYSRSETEISAVFKLSIDGQRTIVATKQNATAHYECDGQVISPQEAKKILNRHIIRIAATDTINTNKLHTDYIAFKEQYPKLFSLFFDTVCNYLNFPFQKDLFAHSTISEANLNNAFERFGAGFQHVFSILLYLFHPEYTILLLEEPEIHLHPSLIRKLLYIFENRNLDNQIFLTTHSPLFIHPQNIHRIFRVTKFDNSTFVHSPRLAGIQLNYPRLLQELNADNCEMLFADAVLLVEGPSDHILMRGLINRFYKGTKDIKVIQVYGKSNIDIYADLLNVFNIPYIAMLDRDALYDTGIKIIQREIHGQFSESEEILIRQLKKKCIYIFPNGSIEYNYPRRYQRMHKHKTQNAMFAASRITAAEFQSTKMAFLREIIEQL
ncbi:MAG: AAA family ATPase [Patescibacteria group bacterium]|nr:AAA family ATPase [Patescibacteria group bacterium]MDD5715082.1 AAA family ATPase [Patescibacteria group bacterium]